MRLIIVFLLSANSVVAADWIVSMSGVQFTPANLTINVGDRVTWRNDQGFHDTVSGAEGRPSGAWNSGLMGPGRTFSVTFNSPTNHRYYCTPHWTLGMIGTITVMGANSAPSAAIINPPNGADFSPPANITVEANAFDSDGSVTQVEFFMNGASIGVRFAPPYTVTANNLGAGNYTFTAVATDNEGATGSASVSVSVSGQQPVVTTAPQSQTANVGSDVLFTAEAAGSSPLSYQWFFGSTPIPNATATSLLLTNVTSAHQGVYTFQVSNPFGSASASATLTVTNPPDGTPPSITTQPESQTVDAGTNVTFTVGVVGSKPLSWQWFFNGTPIPGAMDSSLTLSNVTPADAGEYFVAVTNPFGSATSASAALTVNVPPTCDYALSKSSASFGPGGGTDTVGVITPADCAWTVTNTNGWILVTSGLSGVGPANVTLTILSNVTRSARGGTLVIAGNLFTVTQAASLFAAKNDFNRDGHTDFLWQHTDGRLRLWLMEGATNIGTMFLRASRSVPPGSRVVGTHDFNGDLSVDILWQHPSGRLEVWFMNGTNFVRAEFIWDAPRLGRGWQVAGISDLNSDARADILFRHREGYLLVWFLRDNRFVRQSLLRNGEPVPTDWRIAAVADLNNDLQPDVLWQSRDSRLVIWRMVGTLPISSLVLTNLPRPRAHVTAVSDLNQDGDADFIWRDRQNRLTVWWMSSTNRLGSLPLNNGAAVSPRWKLVAPKN